MKDDLGRHLDGELPLDALSEDVRRQALAWDRLLEGVRSTRPPGSAPPWLETRVMAEIQALPESGPLVRAFEWLLRPRRVRISPLAAGLAVAAVVALFLVRGPGPLPPPSDGGLVDRSPEGFAASIRPGSPAASNTDEAQQLVYVQFALEAPGAASVAVAGDFDDWQGAYELEDLNGDGVWSGRVPVRPGVHAYMFLVDGSTWMTDPRAERYSDDGFGNQNAILAIAAPTT